MSFNLYLSLFTAGILSNLPSAADLDHPEVSRLYYATDTNAFYVFNTTTKAWNLIDQLKPVAVSALPTVGSRATVSDATTPSLGATVAGSGAVQVAVIWDGTNWKVA